MAGPTLDFWQSRFETHHTPWDRGGVSPQLLAWLDSGALQPCRIAVPGCGSGYEVAELARRGFDVIALDYAPAAMARTRELLARQGRQAGQQAQLIQADVLSWQPAQPVDAVYEQTCLCALYPDDWTRYAAQLQRWLRPGGALFALFMQTLRPGAAHGLIEGPPYHCDINAMRALFPDTRWDWPKPPYPRVLHPMGMTELAVPLVRL